MARKLSTISYHPMVTGISRKFATGDQKCVNRTIRKGSGSQVKIPGVSFMGAQVRNVTLNGHGNVQKNIMFFRKPIAPALASSSQIMVRTCFALANDWAKALMNDLSHITANGAKYNAAKVDFSKTIHGVSAEGYESMYGWVRAVAFAIKYNDGDGAGSLPADHVLPNWD